MRRRLFLRSSEFLWQEGHTAHANEEDALKETLKMLDVYHWFSEEVMAMPGIKGEKSLNERFPGAVNTYTIEAMMQDKKALQAGTSHYLGQNFSRAFNINFLNAEGKQELAYTTSWGSSTRLIGGLIMTHSDDDGLVLPPKLAPLHVVILPILHKEEQRAEIIRYCEEAKAALQKLHYANRSLQVEIDTRELTGGEKAWSWVKKGVPFRVEIGQKEYQNRSLFVGRRDKPYKDRENISYDAFLGTIVSDLENMQQNLLERARTFQQKNTVVINSQSDFYAFFNEGEGGFALAHWNGDPAIEIKIKEDLNVTLRCIPLTNVSESGQCIFSGGKSKQRVIFAKAY
jgi:prolyl-tRNA synthetase